MSVQGVDPRCSQSETAANLASSVELGRILLPLLLLIVPLLPLLLLIVPLLPQGLEFYKNKAKKK